MRPASLLLSCFAVAAISFGVACAGDPERPPPAADERPPPVGGGGNSNQGDGGTTRDGGGSLDGGCTDLANTGVTLDQQGIPGDPIGGQGGTLVDGEYNLTDASRYLGMGGVGGPTGTTYRGALRITGSSIERILAAAANGTAPVEVASSGQIQPSGTNLTLVFSCPFDAQEQVTFTANGNTLVLTNLVTKDAFTFTKK